VGPLPERLSKTSMIMDAFADELEKVSGAVTERAPAAGAVLGGAGGAFLGAKGGPRALAGKGVAGAVGGTLLGLLLRHGGRKGEAEPS